MAPPALWYAARMEVILALLGVALVFTVVGHAINLLTDNPHVRLARWLGRMRRGN